MGTVEEIESIVSGLSPEELSQFRAWFEKSDADAWDQQWEANVEAGRLDRLANPSIPKKP